MVGRMIHERDNSGMSSLFGDEDAEAAPAPPPGSGPHLLHTALLILQLS